MHEITVLLSIFGKSVEVFLTMVTLSNIFVEPKVTQIDKVKNELQEKI
jgi:hypothetical protein